LFHRRLIKPAEIIVISAGRNIYVRFGKDSYSFKDRLQVRTQDLGKCKTVMPNMYVLESAVLHHGKDNSGHFTA